MFSTCYLFFSLLTKKHTAFLLKHSITKKVDLGSTMTSDGSDCDLPSMCALPKMKKGHDKDVIHSFSMECLLFIFLWYPTVIRFP